ncbi:hypothetical protein PVC01_090005600 [Plasmodium vivax]|uniref:Uncharacterized protein n=1 Tax=Plasmodium vivax TaxID=5855 RepID=A0A1G4HCA2_PLAVI|nr:hypothetical protein PVC01_090005600 [Plasmodium vivax]
MHKNKINFNRSSEECKKFLCHSVYYKKCESCIHNNDISIKNRNELKKCNSRFSPNEFLYKLFNYLPNTLDNKVMTCFIKLIRIFQLFILQFTVVMADERGEGEESTIVKLIGEYANTVWDKYKELLKKICALFGENDNCEEKVAIPVAVFAFVLLFCIICLICCKCCCKKSCCKKKEIDESDVDYNQFMMGPDGQMYNQMYQGQMMQPQMIPAGMMYPQMYPLMYPQMYPQMYEGTEMQGQGIQGQEMQNSEM